jgi:hypothetical protein
MRAESPLSSEDPRLKFPRGNNTSAILSSVSHSTALSEELLTINVKDKRTPTHYERKILAKVKMEVRFFWQRVNVDPAYFDV